VKAPPYVKCKDSGIEWLGQIPAHWDVKRNALLFDQRDERGYPDLPILNVSIANGVRLREFSDEHIEQKASDHGVYKRALAGDIAFNKMRMWQGAVGVVPEDGLVSPDYTVAVPRDGALPRYFSYLFRTGLHMSKVYWESHGIVDDRNRLYWEGFRDIGEPTPPLPEQQAIADFLDRETANIDALVEKKERLIELLQEKRTVLITHAVTKGLDPNVPMKDSGIEWLGQIPAHWEVRRLGYLATVLQTGPFGSQLHSDEYVSGGIPVINPSNIRGGKLLGNKDAAVDEATWARLARHHLQESDIVFSRRGELGRCALVSKREEGWLCGTGCLRACLHQGRASPPFVVRLLSTAAVSEWLCLQSVGSTMDNLNTEIVGRTPICLPPVGEQQNIATFLDRETAKIDALLAKVGEAIERLKEYRIALISAAVTGKIDVRAV